MKDLIILNETLCRGYEEGKVDIRRALESEKIVELSRKIIEVYENMCLETQGNDKEAFKKCINEIMSIFINYFGTENSEFIYQCKTVISDEENMDCKFYEYILILREIVGAGSKRDDVF